MKKSTAILPFTCMLLFTGCTHINHFTPPTIQTVPATGASKGSAVIAKVADKRPAGTEIFVFSNPPHKWVYQCDEHPESIVHKLIKEALQRRGIAESTNAVDASRVDVEILDFTGHNDPGFWYVGKCLYTIRCGIKIEDSKGAKSFTATGDGTNCIMQLSDKNMNQLLQQTYDAFLQNLNGELEKAGY